MAESNLGSDKYRMTVNPNFAQHNRNQSNPKDRKRNPRRDKVFPAVTEYKVLKTVMHMSLVEVKPVTGFKHQIRAHLGLGLGCPVLGDHKYTSVKRMDLPQRLSGETLHRLGIRQSKVRDLPIYLHSKHVQIPDIVPEKNVWIDAPLPHFFNKALKKLKLIPDKFVKI